jgi:uncharacterized protein
MRALPLLALVLAAPLAAQGVYDLPLTGRVMDGADMLADATEQRLDGLLSAHETQTTNQVVVLTIPSLEGQTVEEVANAVFNAWGLGQAGRDNGVLLLIARDDRALRIEVGYGLEGALADAEAGRIIRRVIVPAFREGDFDGGVLSGVQAILSEIGGERFAGTSYSGIRALDGGDYFALVVALLALALAVRLGRRFIVVSGRFWESRRRFSYGWRALVGGLLVGFSLSTLGGLGEVAFGTPRAPWPYLLGLLLWPLVTNAFEAAVQRSPIWQRYRRRQAGVEMQKRRAREQQKRVLIWQWGRSFWYDGRPPAPSSSSGSSYSSSGNSSSYSSSSYSSSSSFSGGGGSSGGGGASGSW